jgi:hypothetical protein
MVATHQAASLDTTGPKHFLHGVSRVMKFKFSQAARRPNRLKL